MGASESADRWPALRRRRRASRPWELAALRAHRARRRGPSQDRHRPQDWIAAGKHYRFGPVASRGYHVHVGDHAVHARDDRADSDQPQRHREPARAGTGCADVARRWRQQLEPGADLPRVWPGG